MFSTAPRVNTKFMHKDVKVADIQLLMKNKLEKIVTQR
jgi:hypothetical protein